MPPSYVRAGGCYTRNSAIQPSLQPFRTCSINGGHNVLKNSGHCMLDSLFIAALSASRISLGTPFEIDESGRLNSDDS